MKNQSFLNCCNEKNLKDLFYYNKKPKGETDFGIKRYKRKYKICKNCNHMFSYFNFNLKNLYNKKYSENAYGNKEKILNTFNKIISLPLTRSDNKNRVKRCLKYLNKNNLIFDVGCGLSVFLFELKKKGFKVSGLEPDKNLFLHSKNMIKKNIFNKSIEKFKLKKTKKFDFISLNKVLEHIPYPENTIKRIKNILKSNGIFYIEVPDQRAVKFGKNREELMIEHLHVFSKKSLQNLMIRKNFEPIKIRQIKEPSGKYTIYGFFKNK